MNRYATVLILLSFFTAGMPTAFGASQPVTPSDVSVNGRYSATVQTINSGQNAEAIDLTVRVLSAVNDDGSVYLTGIRGNTESLNISSLRLQGFSAFMGLGSSAPRSNSLSTTIGLFSSAIKKLSADNIQVSAVTSAIHSSGDNNNQATAQALWISGTADIYLGGRSSVLALSDANYASGSSAATTSMAISSTGSTGVSAYGGSVRTEGSLSVSAQSGSAFSEQSRADSSSVAYGINVVEASSSAVNQGDLSVSATAGQSQGAAALTYAYASGISAGSPTNSGSLTVSATSGNVVFSAGNTAAGSAEASAFGMISGDSGTVSNTGSMSVSARSTSEMSANVGAQASAYGVQANTRNTVSNSGSIQVQASSAYDKAAAYGVYLSENGSVQLGGTVSALAQGTEALAYGLFLSDGGSAQLDGTVFAQTQGAIPQSNTQTNVQTRAQSYGLFLSNGGNARLSGTVSALAQGAEALAYGLYLSDGGSVQLGGTVSALAQGTDALAYGLFLTTGAGVQVTGSVSALAKGTAAQSYGLFFEGEGALSSASVIHSEAIAGSNFDVSGFSGSSTNANTQAMASSFAGSSTSTNIQAMAYGVLGDSLSGSGSIQARAVAETGKAAAYGVYLPDGGSARMGGTVSAQAQGAGAQAYGLFSGDGASVQMNGSVSALAQGADAQAYGLFLGNGASVRLNGSLSALAQGETAQAYGLYFSGDGTLSSNVLIQAEAAGAAPVSLNLFANVPSQAEVFTGGALTVRSYSLGMGSRTDNSFGTGSGGQVLVDGADFFLVPATGFQAGRFYQVQGSGGESGIMQGTGTVSGFLGGIHSVHPDLIAVYDAEIAPPIQRVALIYEPVASPPVMAEMQRTEHILFSDSLLWNILDEFPLSDGQFARQAFFRPYGGAFSWREKGGHAVQWNGAHGGFLSGANFYSGNTGWGFHFGADYSHINFGGRYDGTKESGMAVSGGVHGTRLAEPFVLRLGTTLLYARNKSESKTLYFAGDEYFNGYESAVSNTFAWYTSAGISLPLEMGMHTLTPALKLTHVWQQRPSYSSDNILPSLSTWYSRLDNHELFGTASLQWRYAPAPQTDISLTAGIRQTLTDGSIRIEQFMDGTPKTVVSTEDDKTVLLLDASLNKKLGRHVFSLGVQSSLGIHKKDYGGWMQWGYQF